MSVIHFLRYEHDGEHVSEGSIKKCPVCGCRLRTKLHKCPLCDNRLMLELVRMFKFFNEKSRELEVTKEIYLEAY